MITMNITIKKTLCGTLLMGGVVGAAMIGCRSRSTDGNLNNVADPLTAQASEVLNLLGAKSPSLPSGSTGYCAGACHAGSEWHGSSMDASDTSMIRDWAERTKLTSECISANAADPAKKLACFYVDPNNAALGYNVQKIGFFRGSAHLATIKAIFTDPNLPARVGGVKAYERWFEAASMPRQPGGSTVQPGFPQLKEEEFRKIEAWSLAGAPHLDEAFGSTPVVGPVQTVACTNDISDDLKKQIEKINHDKKSWAEVNKQNQNMKMLGCATGTTSAIKCFTDATNDKKYPDVFSDSESKGWANRVRNEDLNNITNDSSMPPTQQMRLLKKLPFRSTFWARSSADGRFFGDGLREQARFPSANGTPGGFIPDESRGFIVDLALKDRPFIGVTGPYDPGFFPDNNGFTWMQDGRGYFCNQRILENPNTQFIDFAAETSFCGSHEMGVYQHVGRAIDDKYFIVRSGNYTNDDGGQSGYRKDPSVGSFAIEGAAAELFTMKEKGNNFEVGDPINLPTPFEGDFGISPSASFITSRIASKELIGSDHKQVGYRLRRFDAATKATVPLATVCMRGGKASISFDERFVVAHHYVEDTDFAEFGLSGTGSEFKNRVSNSSNVYIFDLLTNRKFRVTYMGPGQYALYPHFRSDGWLYFLVRDVNKPTSDYVVASDVALRLPTLDASIKGIQ
jgi:hypothetical protein